MTDTAAPASEDRVLVINSGSSSLKFQLLDPQDGTVEAAGLIERVGQGKGNARIVAGEERSTFEGPVPDHVAAMRIVERLFDDVGMSLADDRIDRKSTRLNSSHVAISYAVFCLKNKKTNKYI